jgi:CoA:oxalate CoA-transferase
MAGGPLTGRIVVDLTTALAGPYATLLLAGLGARVVKAENPYLAADGLSVARARTEDMSVSWMARGRGKQSVTLNLSTPTRSTSTPTWSARPT